MRAILIRLTIALAGVAIAWLLGARQLSLLLDQLFTPRLYALPVSPLAYSLDTLSIGKFSLDFYADVRTIGVHVYCGSSNRVILSSGGRFFAMGVCTSRDGTGEFEFTPDPGDAVSLVVGRGMLSWPTPLQNEFHDGKSPSRRRNLYYRLVWKKASGANIVMVWRFERDFYPDDGWTSGTMGPRGFNRPARGGSGCRSGIRPRKFSLGFSCESSSRAHCDRSRRIGTGLCDAVAVLISVVE
jgi:hypothetical protein